MLIPPWGTGVIVAAMTRTTRPSDANVEALRRWLEGQDAALEEWLNGTVRPIARRRRTLASA